MAGKLCTKEEVDLKNAIAEIKLQLLLYKYKIKPLFLAVIHLIIRTFFFTSSKVVEEIC